MKLTSKQLSEAAEARTILDRMDRGAEITIHVGNDEAAQWTVTKDDELYSVIRADVEEFIKELGLEL